MDRGSGGIPIARMERISYDDDDFSCAALHEATGVARIPRGFSLRQPSICFLALGEVPEGSHLILTLRLLNRQDLVGTKYGSLIYQGT